MNEDTKHLIEEMEAVAKKTFERVKPDLMCDKELMLGELGDMIDIVKDSAKILKYTATIKQHYTTHSERYV